MEVGTATEPEAGLLEALNSQRRAWDERPAVRELYRGWYAEMAERLAAVEGPTVELGCGIGTFKEFHPQALATDIAPTPWAEQVVDAERLPFADGSVANLVMTDVLHHLPRPGNLFREAERVLAGGGRLVALEPYCSTLSYPAFRLLHREGADLGADPLADEAQSSTDPLDANNAVPTIIFWRRLAQFQDLHPALRVVERKRFALFAYPLSGGFEGRRLAPDFVIRALARAERPLGPLAGLLAFRCLVVLERDG